MIVRPVAARVFYFALAAGLASLTDPPSAPAQPIKLWPPADPGTFAATTTAATGSSDPATTVAGTESIPLSLSVPTVTKALLPGHWEPHGARWVWVKPETRLRPVQAATLVPGCYVWRRGAYVWVPAHYPKPEEGY